jgi:hypothetical protein
VSRVLVAGSYPPVRSPAATLTLSAARRALGAGDEVIVVSPRPSAAQRHAGLRGWHAGWSLARIGRAWRADTLVLCLEPTVPFDPGAPPARTRRAVVALRWSLRRFRDVRVIVSGDLGVPGAALASMWPGVGAVVVADDEGRRYARDILGILDEMLEVEPGEPATTLAPAHAGPGSVTASGPGEWQAGQRLWFLVAHVEQRATRGAHRLLGPHASKLGRPLRSLLRPLRRGLRRRVA